MIVCDQCGRHHEPVRVWPIHCACRNRIGLDRIHENQLSERRPQRARRPVEFPCLHRGEVLRKLDCGCAGDSRVFACAVYGECAIRKLKPGIGPEATCNVCESRDG